MYFVAKGDSMVTRSRSGLATAFLATLTICGIASADWITDVNVFPTCSITPDDRVVLEVFILTSGIPSRLTQPSEVVIEQHQVHVDVFSTSGPFAALGIMLATVDLGTFDAGMYEYTVVLNSHGQQDIAQGQFAVTVEPCLSAQNPHGRLYWTDSPARVIKRCDPEGNKIENLAILGLSEGFLEMSDFVIDREAGKLYWSSCPHYSAFAIRRADLDGLNTEEFISDLGCVQSLALAPINRWLYWRDDAENSVAKVQRARLDGSNVEDIIPDGLSYSRGIALDVDQGKVYVGDCQKALHLPCDQFRILRVDEDGANLETLIETEPVRASEVSVHLDSGKIYWVESPSTHGVSDGTMWRMNLDGSEVEMIIADGVDCPDEIVFDSDEGKMYWSGRHASQQANLNGTQLWFVGGGGGLDLTVDEDGRMIYWTHSGWAYPSMSGQIKRASQDAPVWEEIVATGLGDPDNLVFVPFDSCCRPDGTCEVSDQTECIRNGGTVLVDAVCTIPAPCCFPDGGCQEMDPVCCVERGGLSQDSGLVCEGDMDGDTVDGVCGDLCPVDVAKMVPGLCGCNVVDADSDGDTVADCVDNCPETRNPFQRDADGDGVGNLCDDEVPASSTWGIAILAFVFLILAKVCFRARKTEVAKSSAG